MSLDSWVGSGLLVWRGFKAQFRIPLWEIINFTAFKLFMAKIEQKKNILQDSVQNPCPWV